MCLQAGAKVQPRPQPPPQKEPEEREEERKPVLKKQPQRTHIGFGPPRVHLLSKRQSGSTASMAPPAAASQLASSALPDLPVKAEPSDAAPVVEAAGKAGKAAQESSKAMQPFSAANLTAASSPAPAAAASAVAPLWGGPGSSRAAAGMRSNDERPTRAQAAADRAHNNAVLAAAAANDEELARMLQRDELGGAKHGR